MTEYAYHDQPLCLGQEIYRGAAKAEHLELIRRGVCREGEPFAEEPMDRLTEEQVQIALSRADPGLSKYLRLQSQVQSCDVSTYEGFQRLFSGFYRVRRNSRWKLEYFKLMEASKLSGIDFPKAVQEINGRCGRIEASFASKLVATLDPSKPVIDQFVLDYFGMQLPRWGSQGRESKTVNLHYELCAKYVALIESPTGKFVRKNFDLRYPDSPLTELKKIDLVLWQIRP
jgi:hypothetical protein